MYLAQTVSVWLALPLAVLAAGFLVRVFIIFTIAAMGHTSNHAKQTISWALSPALFV